MALRQKIEDFLKKQGLKEFILDEEFGGTLDDHKIYIRTDEKISTDQLLRIQGFLYQNVPSIFYNKEMLQIEPIRMRGITGEIHPL